jgi:hypothetical protein
MADGGGAALPTSPVDLWLVCDACAELMPEIRRWCHGLNVKPVVRRFRASPTRLCAFDAFLPPIASAITFMPNDFLESPPTQPSEVPYQQHGGVVGDRAASMTYEIGAQVLQRLQRLQRLLGAPPLQQGGR